MKEINLTQGYVALVDDKDYEWLNQWKWFIYKAKNTCYAARKAMKKGKPKYIWMHREIMETPDNKATDHKDGNGLNNQRSNLRICTPRQNSQNKHMPKENRYPGVNYYGLGKWVANIGINKETKLLGHFNMEQAAFRAYYDACEELGEPPLYYTYPVYPVINIYPDDTDIWDLPFQPEPRRLTWKEKKYEYRKAVEFQVFEDTRITIWNKLENLK